MTRFDDRYKAWIASELFGRELSLTALKRVVRGRLTDRDMQFDDEAFGGALDDLQYVGKIEITKHGRNEYIRRIR